MSQKTQSIVLIVHAVIIVALLACVTALAWEGKIGEQAVVAVIGAVLGLVGGSAGTLAVQGFTQNTLNADTTPVATTAVPETTQVTPVA